MVRLYFYMFIFIKILPASIKEASLCSKQWWGQRATAGGGEALRKVMAGCSSWNRTFLSLPLRLRKLNLRAGRQREGGEMLFSDTAQPCSHALRATVAVYSRSLQGHSLPWWTLLTHSRGGALLSCMFTEELRGSWGTVNTHGHTDDPGSTQWLSKNKTTTKSWMWEGRGQWPECMLYIYEIIKDLCSFF